MDRFKKQNIIVTGGTRGIGKAITQAFLSEGANVLALYNSNHHNAKKFLEENSQYKEKLKISSLNICDYNAVEDFFSKKLPFQEIHVLINNAGIRRDKILAMMDKDSWDNVISTNLSANFYMAKFAVLNMMRQRYGRIINITSPCSHFGFEGQSNYASSKAGQIGMMRSLSKEVAKRSITVNCISPGFIETEFIAELPKELIELYKKQIPLKRFGSSDDVANAVLFLAQKESSYITGTTLEVTGGL